MVLHINNPKAESQLTRVGVYGVVKQEGKVLLVIQDSGPCVGLFDLPGGGMEFGETPSQTLHREFIEELGMDFTSMSPLNNFSTLTEVPALNGKPEYTFYRIGMVYSVEGLFGAYETAEKLQDEWIDLASLRKEKLSPLAWECLMPNLECSSV